MNRRAFIEAGASGIAAFGAGCAGPFRKKVAVKQASPPIEMEKRLPKPVGTMQYAELGTTGINVSKFGFGSHMSTELLPYTKEREWMIREAFDLGVNFFDIYDHEFEIFQYEPTAKYLDGHLNDVVISITAHPWGGRTVEQQLEHDIRIFKKGYVDMVRIHAWKRDPNYPHQLGHTWDMWETLFKFKEKGLIRAVGVPVHTREDLKQPLRDLPLDFVIFPYNFYHNWLWGPSVPPDEKIHTIVPALRKKGIGVITMKPFAGDNLVAPFKALASGYDETGEVSYARACLRYVINSGLAADSTLGGMYNPYHVYENIGAYFQPEMSDQEKRVLDRISDRAKVVAKHYLPEHYRFLEAWRGDVPDKNWFSA